MPFKSLPMAQAGVALVAVPSVVGMLGMQRGHDAVPLGFCKNRSGRNGLKSGVSFDFAAVFNTAIRLESVAIHQQKLGNGLELRDGPMHGQVGGLQNIDLIDFGRTRTADGPMPCR